MSENVQKTPLSLVSSFHEADYLYSFTNDLDYANDPLERQTVMNGFRGAAKIAGIRDYHLSEGKHAVTIYLKTPLDVHRFKIATLPTDQVEQEFVQADYDYDFRKLKRAGVRLQRLTDQAGFGNTILFGVIRANRSIAVLASSKQAYLAFDDYVAANKDKFEPFFDLQRDEPEFDLPVPTAAEAISPNIIIEEETPSPQQHPASDRFIRGGATYETITPSRGQLSLVKSFNATNYPFTLTPVIRVDPTKSHMDKLCENRTDFETIRYEAKLERTIDNIRRAMDGADVEDYCIFADENSVVAHFTHPRDVAVAYASLYPSMEHMVDFVECGRNSSPMKMQTKLKKLQALFSSHGNLDATFVCDMDRKVIKVHVPTTDDLIRVQKVARDLERTNPQFQRLVGLN